MCRWREMNRLTIRKLKTEEYPVLEDFLYEAIFVPKGESKPSREIIKNEDLQVYIKDFGKHNDDYCLIAECDKKIVGACWVRIMNDYGHIADDTPSLAISLYEGYRGKGIGTKLMNHMLASLKEKSYKRISLSVQKENNAVNLYRKVGFHIMEEKEEYIMVCSL